jgi:hypothetical protein
MLLGALLTPASLYAMAIFALCPGRDHGGLYGIASFVNAISALGMGMFLLRLVRRTYSTTSLEDRAQLAYGAAFERLTAMQQDRVKWGSRQEVKDGSNPDEREAAMQREAEGRAFRMLKLGLPVLVALYWATCLSMPVGPIRAGLLFSAVALSGLVLVVLALPEVIRVWMRPDEVGEPRVVAMGREV